MFLILTKDLMIQSSASSAARSQGTTMASAGTIDSAIHKMTAANVEALFVDLQTPGLVLSELVPRLAELANRPTVIAFAQHVEEELLALANTDVIDRVLTRGQFSHQLPRLIKEHAVAGG